MKIQIAFKYALVPAALAIGLGLSGCATETRADAQAVNALRMLVELAKQNPIKPEVQDEAARDANQAAVNDGVQQGVTGQITGDLYSSGVVPVDGLVEPQR